MRMRRELTAWIGIVGLSVASIACDNTAQGVREDAAEAQRDAAEATAAAQREAAEATAEVREGAARAGESVADAARETGTTVGNALENAGRAGDAAVETFDVKAALMADRSVDASDINVDTDHVTKTVVLKGRVPTEAQRTTAEGIARRQAVGYRVDNQLTIAS